MFCNKCTRTHVAFIITNVVLQTVQCLLFTLYSIRSWTPQGHFMASTHAMPIGIIPFATNLEHYFTQSSSPLHSSSSCHLNLRFLIPSPVASIPILHHTSVLIILIPVIFNFTSEQVYWAKSLRRLMRDVHFGSLTPSERLHNFPPKRHRLGMCIPKPKHIPVVFILHIIPPRNMIDSEITSNRCKHIRLCSRSLDGSTRHLQNGRCPSDVAQSCSSSVCIAICPHAHVSHVYNKQFVVHAGYASTLDMALCMSEGVPTNNFFRTPLLLLLHPPIRPCSTCRSDSRNYRQCRTSLHPSPSLLLPSPACVASGHQ